ncbi:MAG: DUF4395 domain-containing protein [Thiomicrospira sp.]|uniref:DUF4395 domain-containing protein n=1 Tax=Thiomicrospira sp. TaxID=935 RepID=UPI0019F2E2E9|nr:DUF4395 domain-containing protein [Thiomicrospira sp.]MBE0492767.1 DUF4395 domain-containing protein [Thiomicrospira sp.]
MWQAYLNAIKNLWFRDPSESPLYINDTAVRVRAGILLVIPLYMGLTLYDAIYVSNWIVDGNTSVDTYELDWDGHIIYQVEAIRRTFDWTIQTWVLFYALFDMLSGMSKWTSRLSPTILIASLLAADKPAVWKPLVPKRFAWTLGSIFIVVCIVFFNPDSTARILNSILGTEIPTHINYMPFWIPLVLVWVCLGFMWMEAILGFCVGCKIHSMLVWMGIIKEECETCNNIDWDEIARRHQERQQQKSD